MHAPNCISNEHNKGKERRQEEMAKAIYEYGF
jgi:hypothetical protein